MKGLLASLPVLIGIGGAVWKVVRDHREWKAGRRETHYSKAGSVALAVIAVAVVVAAIAVVTTLLVSVLDT